MLNFKKILLFTFSFIGIYALLNFVVPAMGLDQSYRKAFITNGNIIFKNWGDNGKVYFHKGDTTYTSFFKHPFKEYDDFVRCEILNKDHEKLAKVEIEKAWRASGLPRSHMRNFKAEISHAYFYTDVWQFAWIPLMLIISLILATPVPWKRRLIALAMGVGLTLVFTFFRFWIRFVVEINRHGWLEVGTQGDTMKWIFKSLNTVFMFMGIALIVPVVIWFAVTFRKGDGKIFLLEDED